MAKIIGLDTETTGFELHHNDQAFFVSTCNLDGDQLFWEFDVNPVTRRCSPPTADLVEIIDLLDSVDEIVGHNLKFDVHSLNTVMSENPKTQKWRFPFHKQQDTIIASHMLRSINEHNLTAVCAHYLGEDIEPFEKELGAACIEVRRRVSREYIERNTSHGESWFPKGLDPNGVVVKGGTNWKGDMWLPRAYALHKLATADDLDAEDTELFEHWKTVLSKYANTDSAYTLSAWIVMREMLEEQDLWDIYEKVRIKLPEIAYKMEVRGVSCNRDRLAAVRTKFHRKSHDHEEECYRIAGELGYDLKLPKTGANDSLRVFMFDTLKLPVVKRAEKGGPSLDKDALTQYSLLSPKDLQESGARPEAKAFIENLMEKRGSDTALTYLDSYTRMWKVSPSDPSGNTRVIHPSLNITGTDTLRWSCSGFNEQNISKRENFNQRVVFGPGPGREWWSLDAQNIELRIFAFDSQEQELIDLFLRPKEQPYFGSYHLAIFDLLHPKLFAEHGVKCKDVFESTWYQWVKNGNFAVIYGAQEYTADRTYRVDGAFKLIRKRFPKLASLSEKHIGLATRLGYVETWPDKDVNPRRGYPLWCSRGGRPSPTVPLNYRIQSTAMQWTAKAMLRCDEILEGWRSHPTNPIDAWLTMQVHDEIVFDLPRRGNPVEDKKGSNYKRVLELKAAMERGGEEDLGLPTPVSIEYNPVSWDTGYRL